MKNLPARRFLFFNLLLSCSLFYCTAVVNAQAQTETSPEQKEKNSLAQGSWAFQFLIDENFKLSAFRGSTISVKRHFSDKRAIRLGLELNAVVSDADESILNDRELKSKADNELITISAYYTIYPSPGKDVNLFYGAGPKVGFSLSGSTVTVVRDVGTSTRIKSDESSWSAGITGILGVEWFATRSVSLTAEYSSIFEYQSISIERTDELKTGTGNFEITNKTERDVKNFRFNPESVKFGLSVYF